MLTLIGLTTKHESALIYLHITRITIHKGTPHLKSPKNQNRRAALGRPAMKLLGGGGGGEGGEGGGGGLQIVCGRQTLAFGSALIPQAPGFKNDTVK